MQIQGGRQILNGTDTMFILTTLLVVIVASAPTMAFAQQAQNATQGFGGPPSGPLTAIRHVFHDPTLRVWHFCKPNDKIMMYKVNFMIAIHQTQL